jgi:serine kinase of HPr protein (carbohydrate metabolism regulator)
LALRLIDGGARLIADDQTELRRAGTAVIASPPATIAGQIEARGIGILRVPFVAGVPLRLVVDLVSPEAVERMPEQAVCELLQRPIPCLALAPFEASAPAKIRFALAALAQTAFHPISVAS